MVGCPGPWGRISRRKETAELAPLALTVPFRVALVAVTLVALLVVHVGTAAEATSRSVNLWRSDYCAHPFPPLGAEMETQGIIPWVPLNAGTFSGTAPGTPPDGASLYYALRSCYSTGFTYGLDRLSIDMMKRVADEFREVRPYFYGDYYSLTPYTDDPAAWSFLQLDRPDQKDGLVICLRRPGSPTASMKPALHAIDPNAQYDVELRTGLDKVDAQSMSGQDLENIEVSIPDKPGSVLIFYKQQ